MTDTAGSFQRLIRNLRKSAEALTGVEHSLNQAEECLVGLAAAEDAGGRPAAAGAALSCVRTAKAILQGGNIVRQATPFATEEAEEAIGPAVAAPGKEAEESADGVPREAWQDDPHPVGKNSYGRLHHIYCGLDADHEDICRTRAGQPAILGPDKNSREELAQEGCLTDGTFPTVQAAAAAVAAQPGTGAVIRGGLDKGGPGTCIGCGASISMFEMMCGAAGCPATPIGETVTAKAQAEAPPPHVHLAVQDGRGKLLTNRCGHCGLDMADPVHGGGVPAMRPEAVLASQEKADLTRGIDQARLLRKAGCVCELPEGPFATTCPVHRGDNQ